MSLFGQNSAAQNTDTDKLSEKQVDALIGQQVVDLVDNAPRQDQYIDLSEVTVMDDEIRARYEGMSNDYLKKQIVQLESEAVKLEAKISSLTIKERAKWDEKYPFSIGDYDAEQ